MPGRVFSVKRKMMSFVFPINISTMRSILILSMAALLCGPFSLVRAQGIVFEQGTFAELKSRASAAGKPIFIDAYTTWCGPCKMMSRSVFPDAQVGAFYNPAFVSAKIDMEKGEGVELARQFRVNAYPTLLFLNASGEVIHRAVGARGAAEFIELGRQALNPEENLAGMTRRFNASPGNPQLAFAYLSLLEESGGGNPAESLNAYLATQPRESWAEPHNWKILYHLIRNPENPLFQNLMKEKAAFQARYTADSVTGKIRQVLFSSLHQAAYSGDEELWNKRRDAVRAEGLPNSERVIARTYIELAGENPDELNRRRVAYLDAFPSRDPEELNEMAWGVYETGKEAEVLRKAEGWAKTALDVVPDNPLIRDTYAALLFRNNKLKEAREQALLAIDQGEKAGEKMEGTRELLTRIDQALKPKAPAAAPKAKASGAKPARKK